MKWVIGLRNIKTGIAICICLIIAALLKLEYPFYAAIATIISMENSVTNSYLAGKQRTMGTLVGAVVGAGFAFIEPGNAYYCALGVIVVIYICNLLKWNKSVSIGCIVFLAIMLNLKDGENPLSYGFHRITDTLIGIVVAVVVNYVVFPPKHEISLHKARKAVARRMAQMFEQMAEKGEEEANLKSLRSQLASLEKYYQLCKYEFHLKKDLTETMEQIGLEIESYRHMFEHLIMLQSLVEEHHLKLKAMEADAGNRWEQAEWDASDLEGNSFGGKPSVENSFGENSSVKNIGESISVANTFGKNNSVEIPGEKPSMGDTSVGNNFWENISVENTGENTSVGNPFGKNASGENTFAEYTSAKNNAQFKSEGTSPVAGSHGPGNLADPALETTEDSSAYELPHPDLQQLSIVYDYHVRWIYNEMQKLGLPLPHPGRIRKVGGVDKSASGNV